MHRAIALGTVFALGACHTPSGRTTTAPPAPGQPVAEQTAVPVALQHVAGPVWLHTSTRHLANMGPVPSHGLVVAVADGVLLVDTAWGADATRVLLAQIETRFGRLPEAAILTHSHDDRAGGIAVLHARGIATYALDATSELLRKEGLPGSTHPLIPPVDSRRLGGVAVEAYYPGAAHTADNIVVWLPEYELLFGGCMIRPAGSDSVGNVADADLDNWHHAALAVAARYQHARIVVPSHGPPAGAELLQHTVALVSAPE